MTSTSDERRTWTEEAVAVMSSRPEANSSLQTTETAAWRAGFVAGWIALRAKIAGEPTPSGLVPIER